MLALEIAIENNDISKLDLMLTDLALACYDMIDSYKLCRLAVKRDNFDVLELLLSHGAYVDIELIQYAHEISNDIRIINLLESC